MNHRRNPLRGALSGFLLVALTASLVAAQSSNSVAATRVQVKPAQTGTLFVDNFADRKAWSANDRTRLRVVKGGQDSARAVQLRARTRGVLVATATAATNSRAGAKHRASAWFRSTRGKVPTRLVLREIDPGTRKVLTRKTVRITAGAKWKRIQVGLTTKRSDSLIRVSTRTNQRVGDRVLLDRVRVKRTTTGVSAAAKKKPSRTSKSGAFPNASNTGVPAGKSLSAYRGSMTITKANVVIDAKRITGRLWIKARGVVIRNSKVNGQIYVERSGSLNMTDSTVDGGTFGDAAVAHYNLTLKRVEIMGARVSVSCGANCHIEDSWLHAQYIAPGSAWHGDGFLTNGGSNFTLRHNTLACDSKVTGSGGACSAALAAYGDFEPIVNLKAENNLFVSSPAGFCMYGGYDTVKPYGKGARNVKITNNVFARGANGKCGVYGAATFISPDGRNGNSFTGNVWDDGRTVRPGT